MRFASGSRCSSVKDWAPWLSCQPRPPGSTVNWPPCSPPEDMIMKSDHGSFAPVLWILFATTGVFVIAIAIGIRLFFRRGKSVTDL